MNNCLQTFKTFHLELSEFVPKIVGDVDGFQEGAVVDLDEV